jgi:hypothetical protein
MTTENENDITKTSLRAPTKRMIEKLKECFEKESSNIQIPCLPEDIKSSLAGLYKRGLINTKMERVNGKKVLCVYVTAEGKKFLLAQKERQN